MADLESKENPAISLAARLSAMGGIYDPANRRGSFGASKLSLEEVKGEGGMLDKALAFTQPSLLPLLNPITLDENKDSDIYLDVKPKFVMSNVALHTKCTDLLVKQADEIKSTVTKELLDISEEDFTSLVKVMKEGDPEMSNRQCALLIACDAMNAAHSLSINHTQSMLNLCMQDFVLPMLDEVQQVEVKDALKNLCQGVDTIAQRGIAQESESMVSSPSTLHFKDAMKKLVSLFESYNKLNTQCIKAQGENESAMADVEGGLLENEELDAKILEVESTTRRVASLSAIRDRKLNAIFSDLEHRYPDIAGSTNATTQRHKAIALHKLVLPQDIITGPMDHKKSTKLVADLLQICQAWLPLFYAVIPFLMQVQDHEDKFHPLEPPSFAEIKSKYGKALGEVIEAQFSQLWLVVARGNPESLSQLTLGSSQESLFSEIKTGGNGEPTRKSNVEHRNILTFVCYVQHYHEKELRDDRRRMEAILNVAWVELCEGSIIKACERLLAHWKKAMPLGAIVPWHAFMQKSIIALRTRCGGDMHTHLTQNYLDNESLKETYSANCLPVWNKYLSDVMNLARNLQSDSPSKFSSSEVQASRSTLTAFAGTIEDKGQGELSDWKCCAKDCDGNVKLIFKTMVMASRKKANDPNTKCPAAVLCPTHHAIFTKGEDVVLADGSKKKRSKHQGKTTNAKAAVTETDDKGADGDDDKPKGKNHEKNRKQKARRKAAMALLKEKEEHEGKDNDKGSAENSSPDTSSSSSSSNSSASFDPASLTGEQLKTAAKYLSGMSLLSNASASPAKSNPDAKCAQGSIVRRLQNYFDPCEGDSSPAFKANANAVTGDDAQSYYVPK